MDGAQDYYLETAVDIMIIYQRVDGREICDEAYGVSQCVADFSEDLGCSSN